MPGDEGVAPGPYQFWIFVIPTPITRVGLAFTLTGGPVLPTIVGSLGLAIGAALFLRPDLAGASHDGGLNRLPSAAPMSVFCLLRCRGVLWQHPVWPREVAGVAVRIAFEVILMLRLRLPEGACRLDFRDNLARPQA